MSIDERLRAGLAANTAALTPGLSDELDALGHRVRRRRRTRHAIYVLVTVSVVAAVALWAPGTIEGLRERALPADHTSVPSPAPTTTPLSSLPEGSAVVPGRYAGEFSSTTRSGEGPRAVITIPAGYLAGGASAVSVGDADSPFRHLDLWTVSKVVKDPCSGPVYTDPGPSVQDLADALAALPVWKSTKPKPVTVGGYNGLVMDFDVPDPTPSGCGDQPYHWVDDQGGSQGLGPGKRQRLWILDVAGDRVMIVAGWFPAGGSDPSAGVTPAQAQELIGMAESITFLVPRTPTP